MKAIYGALLCEFGVIECGVLKDLSQDPHAVEGLALNPKP